MSISSSGSGVTGLSGLCSISELSSTSRSPCPNNCDGGNSGLGFLGLMVCLGLGVKALKPGGGGGGPLLLGPVVRRGLGGPVHGPGPVTC